MSARLLHDLDWHLGVYTLAVVMAIWANAREQLREGDGTFLFAMAVVAGLLGLFLR